MFLLAWFWVGCEPSATSGPVAVPVEPVRVPEARPGERLKTLMGRPLERAAVSVRSHSDRSWNVEWFRVAGTSDVVQMRIKTSDGPQGHNEVWGDGERLPEPLAVRQGGLPEAELRKRWAEGPPADARWAPGYELRRPGIQESGPVQVGREVVHALLYAQDRRAEGDIPVIELSGVVGASSRQTRVTLDQVLPTAFPVQAETTRFKALIESRVEAENLFRQGWGAGDFDDNGLPDQFAVLCRRDAPQTSWWVYASEGRLSVVERTDGCSTRGAEGVWTAIPYNGRWIARGSGRVNDDYVLDWVGNRVEVVSRTYGSSDMAHSVETQLDFLTGTQTLRVSRSKPGSRSGNYKGAIVVATPAEDRAAQPSDCTSRTLPPAMLYTVVHGQEDHSGRSDAALHVVAEEGAGTMNLHVRIADDVDLKPLDDTDAAWLASDHLEVWWEGPAGVRQLVVAWPGPAPQARWWMPEGTSDPAPDVACLDGALVVSLPLESLRMPSEDGDDWQIPFTVAFSDADAPGEGQQSLIATGDLVWNVSESFGRLVRNHALSPWSTLNRRTHRAGIVSVRAVSWDEPLTQTEVGL